MIWRRNALKCAWLLVAIVMVAAPRVARAESPDVELEKLIGRQLAFIFESQLGVVRDPVLTAWVNRIGEDVSAQSPRKDVRFTFRIINTDEVNAYASPGGYVFVTRGLLDTVDSDDELAGVLAHEVGHVTERHAMKQMARSLALILAMGTVRNPRYDREMLGARALVALLALQYSRSQELQADRDGVRFAHAAGYDPRGLVRFFRRLGSSGKGLSAKIQSYLSTHPTNEQRIRQAEADPRLSESDPQALLFTAAGYAGRLESDKAIAFYRKLLRADPANTAGLLGLARSLVEVGDYAGARRSYDAVLRKEPANGDAARGIHALPESDDSSPPLVSSGDLKDIRRRLDEALTRVRARQKQNAGQLERLRTAEYVALRLQQGLIASVNADPRWLAAAYQAYETVERIDACCERVQQINFRTSALVSEFMYASERAETGPADEALRARFQIAAALASAESEQAMELIDKTLPELSRADIAIGGVLADLDMALLDPNREIKWAHLAALEAVLLAVSNDARHAGTRAAAATDTLALARCRFYQSRIDLAVAGMSPARAALFRKVAARYLGTRPEEFALPRENKLGAGEAVIVMAVSRSLGENPAELIAGNAGGSTWVDYSRHSGMDIGTLGIILRRLAEEADAAAGTGGS